MMMQLVESKFMGLNAVLDRETRRLLIIYYIPRSNVNPRSWSPLDVCIFPNLVPYFENTTVSNNQMT
jgi:hypothetical protein